MRASNKKRNFSSNPFSVKAYLEKLEVSNRENGSRSNESRRLREALRAMGHKGGLRSSATKWNTTQPAN